MIFFETKLKDVFAIEIDKIEDRRGFFSRTWCKKTFEEIGLNSSISQCNLSYNAKLGTIRGMHYQTKPYEEAKLVSCFKGKIYDVVVDLRENSETFKQWVGIELSDKNFKMIYVPEGCAHGYQVLEDNTCVFYQVTEVYSSKHEKGIRWDDPKINIIWPIKENIIISEKDKSWTNI